MRRAGAASSLEGSLPQAFGAYRVVELLGRGGRGVVYRCEAPGTAEPVAVKTTLRTEAFERAALEREIAALARLTRNQRPGVVRLLDSGAEAGVPWYAMAFVSGGSLRDYLQQLWGRASRSRGANEPVSATVPTREPALPLRLETRDVARGDVEFLSPAGSSAVPGLSGVPGLSAAPGPSAVRGSSAVPSSSAAAGKLPEVLELALALFDALRHLHADGVVHGDLSPANVLFDAERRPVLVDFGVSFQLFGLETLRELPQLSERRVGTPGFMAPERVRGEPLDPRADLYAAGCILYELVTGRPPFEADTVDGLNRKHLQLAPTPPSQLVEVDAALSELILALLEKEPRRRPSRADDVFVALERRVGPGRAVPVVSLTPSLYRPRLVGREETLAELERLLDEARCGQGGLVTLAGATGCGKTRVVNELHALAANVGLEVVTAICPEPMTATSVASALSVLAPALSRVLERALSGAPQGEVTAELRDAVSVLATYGVGVHGAEPVARPRNVPSPVDVLRSLDVVVAAATRGAALLLTVEDVQWADELTRRFLEERVPALAPRGLLVVATLRHDELDASRLTQVAKRSLTLEALALPAVHAMTRDMLAVDRAPDGLAEFLAHRTEGNPFLVAEYLRAAVAQGVVARQPDGQWTFDTSADARATLPDSLQGLFAMRLGALAPTTRALLEPAAILGREFDAAELAALVAGSPQATSAALDELVGLQLLDYVGVGRYRFPNDQLREALELALDPERRRELHLAAARALEAESKGTEELAEHSFRLGLHFRVAGEPAKALGHLQRAAARARELQDHARVVVLYRMALDASEALAAAGTPVSPRVTTQLFEDLGDALLAQARHAEARAAYERALAELDPCERLPRARNYRKLAATSWRRHLAEARQQLELAAATLGVPRPDDDAEVHREHIEIQLGKFERLYFVRDRSDAARALLESLAGPIDVYGSPGQRVRYSLCAASDAMARCRYAFSEHALALAKKGLEVDPTSLTQQEEALARFIVGFASMLGDVPARQAALEHFAAASHGAELTGDRMLLTRVATYRMLTELRLGSVDGTEAAARRALEFAESTKAEPYAAAAHACLGWVKWRRGDSHGARPSLDEAFRLWQARPGDFPFRWCANFVGLALAFEAEDLAAAATAAKALLDPNQTQLPAPLERALVEAVEALVARRFADAGRAVRAALVLGRDAGFC